MAGLWEQVRAASETASPFLTHEWILSWWETFAADQQLAVLLLRDDHGPAAIAPFARSRRRVGPLVYRAIELIGTGSLRYLGMGLADRADLLLGRRREECARAILAWLASQRDQWEVVDLRFLPAESTTARILTAEAPGLGLGVASMPCAESPYLPLEGTWESYLERRGRSFRKGLKRKQQKLEALGPVEYRLTAGRDDPAAALATACRIAARSWKEQQGTALLLHDNVRAFFDRLLPRLAASDRLYLALGLAGGEPVAHELGFRLDGKLWSYDSCFDRAASDGSPGVLLTARVLEAAWAEGLGEYDFLRGNEGYKSTWSTGVRREIQLVLDSGTIAGRTARAAAFRAKWALKQSSFLVSFQARAAGLLNRLTGRLTGRWKGGRGGDPE